MDKEVVYTHTHTHTHTRKYYSAIKKEQNNAICSNTDGPRDGHIERNQTQKENIIRYHLYVESKKRVQKNLRIYRSRVKDVENNLMVTRGEGGRDTLGDWG